MTALTSRCNQDRYFFRSVIASVLLQMVPAVPLMLLAMVTTMVQPLPHPQGHWAGHSGPGHPGVQFPAPGAVEPSGEPDPPPPDGEDHVLGVLQPVCASGFEACGERCCRTFGPVTSCPPLTINLGGTCVPLR